ncbi:unnamed protein product [Mycena citricolor]|uniref:DUF6534 domain-containing protein n=1 Tax=Mycena citricolor TaxID=2018698 RepID=A0AAD2K1S5_9AGAR|nr:unnamed protein product [Mycena citricolor]CAK5274193.1 unnamed protein product [Mycena citricolor]
MVKIVTGPPENVSHEDIIWLAGPRLVGLILNWCLLGVLSTQVYIFHLNFPKERRFLKWMVYTVYLLDWAQTCSVTYDALQWFVLGWGSIPDLYDLWSSWLNVPVLSSTIAAIVQVYYGWRLYILSGSLAPLIVTTVLSVVQLTGGIMVGLLLTSDDTEISRSPGLVAAVAVRLGGSLAVDTFIAGCMTFFVSFPARLGGPPIDSAQLLRSREKSSREMNGVLTRLIRLVVETGTLTAIAAGVDLIFFLRAKNGLHQVPGVILCKLYSNALLVLFNNRLTMQRDTLVVQDLNTVEFSGTAWSGTDSNDISSRFSAAPARRGGNPKLRTSDSFYV